MKRLMIVFGMMITLSALVPVSKGDMADPNRYPHLTPHFRYPQPTRPKRSPSVSPSPSRTVSEASPSIFGSGVAVAAIATGSLIGIALVRKKNDA
jgi:hypothetical protein